MTRSLFFLSLYHWNGVPAPVSNSILSRTDYCWLISFSPHLFVAQFLWGRARVRVVDIFFQTVFFCSTIQTIWDAKLEWNRFLGLPIRFWFDSMLVFFCSFGLYFMTLQLEQRLLPISIGPNRKKTRLWSIHVSVVLFRYSVTLSYWWYYWHASVPVQIPSRRKNTRNAFILQQRQREKARDNWNVLFYF